jgi:stage IV sporulation protein FB
MFMEPANRTPYDVRFRLFGIPIRITPFYWLVSLMLVMSVLDLPGGIVRGLILIVVWFISLLVHEMGHALWNRYYGVYSSIVLYSLGGVNIADERLPQRWQRIGLSLAGPAAGFLLMGLVWVSNQYYPWSEVSVYTGWTYDYLIRTNLIWGIFNLLPIWPLDGGHVCNEICSRYRPYDGLALTLKISIGLAIVYVLYALAVLSDFFPWLYVVAKWIPAAPFGIIIMGLIAVSNFQLLQQLRQGPRYVYRDDNRPPWR